MSLTVGSLFSGIGGLDLGLERAGMSVKWQAEVDPYCSRVLAKHWPDVPNLGDVTKIEWETVERVDLICGGYPCQPFSLAGARRGHDDARHLWPHFADALRVLRPRFALLENVPGHLSLGFGDVLGDLAELGYDCEWESIPAAAVGAPHLRYRLFIVAYSQRKQLREQPVAVSRGSGSTVARDDGSSGTVADAHGGRREERSERDRRTSGRQRAPLGDDAGRLRSDVADADGAPTEILQGSAARTELARLGASRGSGWWSVEPAVGRVVDELPRRVDRLRALGNAVVPQVAEFVGRALLASLLPQGVPGVNPEQGRTAK